MKVIYIPFNKKNLIFLAISIILVTALIVLVFYNSFNKGVFSVMAPQAIYKGNENLSKVAFACNVVWGTEFIPQMLDIFDERDLKITFFIGGEWAEDNPELLSHMVNAGHELGNHGYYHKHHSQLNIDENIREIRDTEDLIYNLVGLRTRLFAPPYGEFNDITLKAAESLGYRTIMWSIDTIDWRREGARIITDRVVKNPHNGAIILMHPVEDTLEALPTIIDELRNRGFEIGKVSDILPPD
ncbi:MAG: polysaccharide deacetylase family protein [Clostridiales bacterium]|nr:polysaccharide deacetylase family protein [Clostridiales bacterium]